MTPLLTLAAARALADSNLHIEGSKLVDNGQNVFLRGVTVPGLEADDSEDHVFRSCRVAIEDWKANCIRLPICQDRWFGKAPGQKGEAGANYRNQIDEIVSYVTRSNAYLILDLSWSDLGQWGKNLGPHAMPDVNSRQFWKDASHKYKGNGRVIFDLYDSPQEVEESVWLNGGVVIEGSVNYECIGFQKLLQEVRGAGAKNLLLIASPRRVREYPAQSELSETDGRGFLMDVTVDPGHLELRSGGAAALLPALIDIAFSPSATTRTLGTGFFEWLQATSDGWTARPLSPASNGLISDWLYTPTHDWGASVKDELGRK